MASRRDTDAVLKTVARLVRNYPRAALGLGLVAVLVVAVVYFVRNHRPSAPPGSYLLCAWNVENFYDDRDDANIRDDLEDWFGSDSAAFAEKVEHLAAALLLMNDGAGPDIACLVEVENERCLEALRDALNAKLVAAGRGDRAYTHILFEQDNTGRHFAPGILTRLTVIADRTRKLGGRSNGRILEGHLTANGHELTVIAAHWTSRVTDGEGDGTRRMSYAKDCYGRARAILTENPDADVVVCGDFNDTFDEPSLRTGLHAVADAAAVKASADDPRLLALFAGWAGDPPGTIYGKSKWSVFDHVCVTRGLLDDRGWTCDATTAGVFAPKELRRTSKRGEPFPFGRQTTKGDRGFSDHFPVTVRLVAHE